jgi:hypothetical protein
MKQLLISVTTVFLILLFSGCGKGSIPAGAIIDAPEIGFQMRVPTGWQIDRNNPRMCWKDNSTGIILDEPLDGKSFEEYVRHLSNANYGQVISSSPVSINGFDAIRSVIDYPDAGSKSLKAYIHKNDKLIEVSFVAPMEDFPKYEGAFLDSLSSITIE